MRERWRCGVHGRAFLLLRFIYTLTLSPNQLWADWNVGAQPTEWMPTLESAPSYRSHCGSAWGGSFGHSAGQLACERAARPGASRVAAVGWGMVFMTMNEFTKAWI